ncbi:hypothetical protein Gohar_026571, partial [Gossypium harknessii]|nr:hypothetical protein [Gossypium harknessii]
KDVTQYTIATQPSLRSGLSIKFYKFDAYECRQVVYTFLNISRHTTARDVLMYYAKERGHVKEELAKAPSLICLTYDNCNFEHTNDEYICIIAHWVDKE